ncbi:MAG TPA: GIY-YIG nuclease family protein [Longimicrobium sp.]|nr:GIY-YIG nuclease family protein [Longimicrobium sp.]
MNRRELIREYKQRPRQIGIFQVRNTANGKILVGASTDLPAILNRHRAQLRLGAHPNRALREDAKAFGFGAFAFEVLDTLTLPDDPAYDPAADLRTLEGMWLEKLSPFGERGYNGRAPSTGG